MLIHIVPSIVDVIQIKFSYYTLREKCPNTEFFVVCVFLYSVRIQENTDRKKLHIWTLFTQGANTTISIFDIL